MFAALIVSLMTIGQPVPPPANCPDGKCPLVKSNSVSAFSSVQQGNNFTTFSSYSSNYSRVSSFSGSCDCRRHPIRNLLITEARVVNAVRPVNLIRR